MVIRWRNWTLVVRLFTKGEVFNIIGSKQLIATTTRPPVFLSARQVQDDASEEPLSRNEVRFNLIGEPEKRSHVLRCCRLFSWNFTMSEINLACTCCLFKDVIDDSTLSRKDPGSQSRIRDAHC